jgi:amidase
MARFEAHYQNYRNDFIRTGAVRKSGILTQRELKITGEYTVLDLISAMANGSLTTVEVTLAYYKRAAVAHQLVRVTYLTIQ